MVANEALDRWTARALAMLLRGGTALAALIGLGGGIKYLIDHSGEVVALHVFHGEPSDFRSVGGILHGIAEDYGRAFVQLGVVILIAVPIARVALSGIGFAREHDRTYVVTSAIVFLLLLWGLFGG